MQMTEKIIRDRLFEMQDAEYRDFHSRLMPTVKKELIIGVRTPDLRKFANEISGSPLADEFMKILPHKYYEENNLHAFLIEKINDFNLCAAELDRFLPFVDNWATCDMIRPKIFKKHLPELLEKIKTGIESENTYTVRFAIEMLMCYYLDEAFDISYPAAVAQICSDEYYIKMMQAWYFATALAKQYDSVIPYLEQNRLDADTHNKTIRKAIESYRITDEKKKYLRTLKR
ncbi:MAG: DNA alkylation repair protein [Clostridia bacterium]|nr:DNA alkylation repair protein [Clostridia bacterium]